MVLIEVWGHRGAYCFAPENTLTGFAMAADMGADGVELDIQLTKDREIVVIHDETIDRTGSASGNVRDYTLAELKRFNFNKRGVTQPAFMEIPTLAEVFELLKPTALSINIELKTGIIFYEGIEKAAIDLADKYGMADRIIWSSFNHYSTAKVKQISPEARTALLCGGVLITAGQCEAAGAEAIHPHINQIKYPGFLEDCRDHGILVRAWGADELEGICLALESGIDAIFTNRIDLARMKLA